MKCKHEMVNWSKWFRENPQTSHQINCCKHECTTATTNSTNHRSHECKSHKKQIHKFQVSGFTHKTVSRFQNNKTPTLSANSRKFMQTSPCKTQQSLSSLASSQTILSDLTGLKNTSTGAIPQDIALKSI